MKRKGITFHNWIQIKWFEFNERYASGIAVIIAIIALIIALLK
jgi:heme A synthase